MDAKLQLVVDPLLILENLLITHNFDIVVSNHPYNTHTGGSNFYSQMEKVEQRSCEISNGQLRCRWLATLEL